MRAARYSRTCCAALLFLCLHWRRKRLVDMFHLLWELPTITAGEPHGLHAVHGMSMRSSRASTGQPRIPRLIRNTQRIPRHKWCSTEPLLSALPALLGVTDTGTGPRCQGLPGTAEAHRGEAAAAEGAAAGKRDRAPREAAQSKEGRGGPPTAHEPSSPHPVRE